MSDTNRGFDGSSATLTDSASARWVVSPLTGAHNEDRPAKVRVTGADVGITAGTPATTWPAMHAHVSGRSNVTMPIEGLGSRIPIAGCVLDAAAYYSDGTTYTWPHAALTRAQVSGRRDGDITFSMSFRPAPADLALSTLGVQPTRVKPPAFDGTTVKWNSNLLNGLVSISAETTCAEVDTSGAEVSSVLITPGIPEGTVTIELLGSAGTQSSSPEDLEKGKQYVLHVYWTDTGATTPGFGSTPSDAVFELFDIRDGGGVDGDITTEYVFKPSLAA